ncbi:MAG: glycosyltransferase family 2 protein [Candidatus Saccharimonadales bacterium]
MKQDAAKRPKQVSAIIPTYNGSSWLPKTVPKVEAALKAANLEQAEILIIDDGSTDDTVQVAQNLKTSYPLRVVSQKNSGRFMARKKGALEAKYDFTLFVDTRVFISPGSLKYALDKYDGTKNTQVWNSHVVLDKTGNIYARFWDAIAYVAWRKYFANPRDISYGVDEFDLYPKGTTCFLIPRRVLIDANKWFEKNTKDINNSNDDTLLLRRIVEDYNINVSPSFTCLYHARGNLKQYTKHVFHRGKVFVDGFLRNDGNRYYKLLIAFLCLSVAVPTLLIIRPTLLPYLLIAAAIGWILELVLILIIRVPIKDGLSLFLLTPIFSVFYGAGIWKAVLNIYVLKRAR